MIEVHILFYISVLLQCNPPPHTHIYIYIYIYIGIYLIFVLFAKVHIMLELISIHHTSISLMLEAGWLVGGRSQLIC